MAQIALRKTAEEGEKEYPEAAKVLKENTYMDDICHSEETPAKVQQIAKDLDKVLQNGGFHVKKWTTNEKARDEDDAELDMFKTQREEKVLGIAWDNKTDVLRFKVQQESQGKNDDGKNGVPTKRKILSRIARLYDPIGYTAAVVIKAKIGIQKLWQLGYEWDQPLEVSLAQESEAIFAAIEKLNQLELPRNLTPPEAAGFPTICIFSDASREAFGACAYLIKQRRIRCEICRGQDMSCAVKGAYNTTARAASSGTRSEIVQDHGRRKPPEMRESHSVHR